MDNQMSLFDIERIQIESMNNGNLKVVKAEFIEMKNKGWTDLFSGYDEMYGITSLSEIQFVEKVFASFENVEMIFGCEVILNDDISTIISAQIKNVESIIKSKSGVRVAEHINVGSIDIRVSRNAKSHEKILL